MMFRPLELSYVQCTLKAAPLSFGLIDEHELDSIVVHWLAQLDSALKKNRSAKLKSFSDFFLFDWVQGNHASFTTACNHNGSSWFIRILVKMI